VQAFYLLNSPWTSSRRVRPFAEFFPADVGWTKSKVCVLCSRSVEHPKPPMRIEWEEGFDTIGDFSWCSYTAVVTPRVRRLLRSKNSGCTFSPVNVLPYKGRKRQPHVPWPYKGPPLHWIRPRHALSIDPGLSRLRRDRSEECPRCQPCYFRFKGRDLVLRRASWNGSGFFYVREFLPSDAIFAVESVVAAMHAAGFSNMGAVRAGHIT
jgi:hypothetical protein